MFLVGGIVAYVRDLYAPVPRPEPMQAFDLEFDRLDEPNHEITGFEDSDDPDTMEEFISKLQSLAEQSFTWVNEIILRDGAELVLDFWLQDGTIRTDPVAIHTWYPGIGDTDIFNPGSNTAISWQDTVGRYGLWVHSGHNQTMSELQNWIERNEHGNRVAVDLAEDRLQSLVGSTVYLIQNDEPVFATIKAAIRIGPWEVEELSTHVMDLVEYLADYHPGHGFDALRSRQDVLVLYFCGMALVGETPNSNYDRWTQARFIIALVPYAEGQQGLIVE